jgi:hypothetical protein
LDLAVRRSIDWAFPPSVEYTCTLVKDFVRAFRS